MSNMPIMSNQPSASNKSTTQTSAGGNTNDLATTDTLLFGDVLTRQISGKVGIEANAVDLLAADTAALPPSESAKVEEVLLATADTPLPADMLATLLPVAVAVAQMAATAQDSAGDTQTQLEPLVGELNQSEPALPASTSLPAFSAPKQSENPVMPSLEMNAAVVKPPVSPSKESQLMAGVTDTLALAKKIEGMTQPDTTLSAPGNPTNQINLVQSLVNTSTVTAPATQLVISTPITQRPWGNEFSQKITWMATQQEQHAELHLNPAQLGPVDVVIKVSGDQATAQFTSAHAAVREVIEQSIPKLREMLADNGIMLGNTTVSDQTPREQRGEFGTPRQTAPSAGVPESAPANINEARVVTPLIRHNGMVDTFA